MEMTITCAQYAQISNVFNNFEQKQRDPDMKYILYERSKHRQFLVATDRRIMVVWYIGDVEGPDFKFFMNVDDVLINQCKNEIQYHSSLHYFHSPELNYTSVKTTFGYEYPGNAGRMPENNSDILKWRMIFPEEMPKKSKGNMSITISTIYNLWTASPSGKLIFPTNIEDDKPIVVRDMSDPNWYALFIPSNVTIDNQSIEAQPIKIPEWIK